tara:strand:+ start:1420 stop:2076 length:657 start_codon:yes stop_codon:yes gene_type:complete
MIDVYRSDYFARLITLGTETLYDQLCQKYSKSIVEGLVSQFLSQTPHRHEVIEVVFSDFADFCRREHKTQLSLADDARCLWELHAYMHYTADEETVATIPAGTDLQHIFIRPDVQYIAPAESETDFYDLISSECSVTVAGRGLLFKKLSPVEPIFMGVAPVYSSLIQQMQRGHSLYQALEGIDDGCDELDLSRFIADLFDYLFFPNGMDDSNQVSYDS